MEATECVSPSCSSKQKRGLLRKMLKCLHVVCVPCLRQGLDFNGSFRCPQTDCSSLTKGKGVGLAYLIDTLPDALRQHGSTATQTSSVDAREMASVWPPACEDCIDQEIAEPETAAGQCTVCARLLCQHHSGLHPKRKQFSGHSVMELEKSGLSDSGIDTVSSPSEDESRTPALPSTRQGRHYQASLSPCPHHQGSPVQLYCTNCDAYLCEVCETSARCREESHVVQEFAEAAEPLLTDLCAKFGVVPSWTADQPPPQADSGASAKEEGGDPSTISHGNQVTNADQSSVRTRAVAQEPSTSLGDQLVEAIAAVEEDLSGMQSQSEKLSEKVTKHFSTLRERLQARERQLLDQLGSLHNKKAAPVEQRSIKLKSALDSFSRASCYLSALESSDLQENSLSLLRSSQWFHEIYSSSACVYENCRVGNHCHGLKLEFDPKHHPLDIEATGHVRDATELAPVQTSDRLSKEDNIFDDSAASAWSHVRGHLFDVDLARCIALLLDQHPDEPAPEQTSDQHSDMDAILGDSATSADEPAPMQTSVRLNIFDDSAASAASGSHVPGRDFDVDLARCIALSLGENPDQPAPVQTSDVRRRDGDSPVPPAGRHQPMQPPTHEPVRHAPVPDRVLLEPLERTLRPFLHNFGRPPTPPPQPPSVARSGMLPVAWAAPEEDSAESRARAQPDPPRRSHTNLSQYNSVLRSPSPEPSPPVRHRQPLPRWRRQSSPPVLPRLQHSSGPCLRAGQHAQPAIVSPSVRRSQQTFPDEGHHPNAIAPAAPVWTSYDFDPDMARAIALSLGENPDQPAPAAGAPAVPVQTSFDLDLARAIALSLG